MKIVTQASRPQDAGPPSRRKKNEIIQKVLWTSEAESTCTWEKVQIRPKALVDKPHIHLLVGNASNSSTDAGNVRGQIQRAPGNNPGFPVRSELTSESEVTVAKKYVEIRGLTHSMYHGRPSIAWNTETVKQPTRKTNSCGPQVRQTLNK